MSRAGEGEPPVGKRRTGRVGDYKLTVTATVPCRGRDEFSAAGRICRFVLPFKDAEVRRRHNRIARHGKSNRNRLSRRKLAVPAAVFDCILTVFNLGDRSVPEARDIRVHVKYHAPIVNRAAGVVGDGKASVVAARPGSVRSVGNVHAANRCNRLGAGVIARVITRVVARIISRIIAGVVAGIIARIVARVLLKLRGQRDILIDQDDFGRQLVRIGKNAVAVHLPAVKFIPDSGDCRHLERIAIQCINLGVRVDIAALSGNDLRREDTVLTVLCFSCKLRCQRAVAGHAEAVFALRGEQLIVLIPAEELAILVLGSADLRVCAEYILSAAVADTACGVIIFHSHGVDRLTGLLAAEDNVRFHGSLLRLKRIGRLDNRHISVFLEEFLRKRNRDNLALLHGDIIVILDVIAGVIGIRLVEREAHGAVFSRLDGNRIRLIGGQIHALRAVRRDSAKHVPLRIARKLVHQRRNNHAVAVLHLNIHRAVDVDDSLRRRGINLLVSGTVVRVLAPQPGEAKLGVVSHGDHLLLRH